jgi:predicted ATPase/transcriptional regulator with XRE-family HTH domain
MGPASILPEQFASFGELLKYLRRKARLTQRELAIAVGYSDTQISRMEQNQRVPDSMTIQALFVPALYIEQEPKWVERLLELARIAPEGSELDMGGKSTAPNNLPTQLTSFVGRTKEIEEICRLVKTHRLITLTGSGGVGKTRLSLQVGSELLASFPNGVWLVEFAPISDLELVAFTLANIFGLRESGKPSSSLTELLVDYFRPRKALLIFDNCEHLIKPIAGLADVLLQACQDLSILASSREVLGVGGEVVYHVPSLALPDLKSQLSVEALGKYESVKLFIERSSTAVPSFTLTNDHAPVLAQISHRLDGIPLAIELAAAKIRVLSMEQIAERLEDRFQLLTGGSRTALERHQTLRAAIDWSYNLLTGPEECLLRRLSVFVGGWTLGAAETVCGFEGIEASDVLDLLTHLVDKSLVTVDTHDGEARYHMLETIRQYARGKLIDSGENDLLRQEHGNWFLKLAESIEHELFFGHDGMRWLNQTESDLDNFRAALSYFLASSKLEECAWLASKLGLFWLDRNYFAEGRHWLETGLAHRETISKTTTAHTLRVLGRLLARMGDYDEGIKYEEESVALFRELGDKFQLALALKFHGTVIDESGDGTAFAYYEEALQLYRELNYKAHANDILLEIGWGNVITGNFPEGFAKLEECLKSNRELNRPAAVAYSLFILGVCRWHSHEYDASEIASKESMRLYHQLGNKWFMMAGLGVLAGIACGRGEPEQASKYVGISDKAIESIGGVKPPFWLDEVYNPILEEIHTQIDDSTYIRAWNAGHSMTLEQGLEFALDLANG